MPTNINQLCFEKFYWGYLIDSKVGYINLIKEELLWGQVAPDALEGVIYVNSIDLFKEAIVEDFDFRLRGFIDS
jgi:hypothetical protein